jgi:hypothetical protein
MARSLFHVVERKWESGDDSDFHDAEKEILQQLFDTGDHFITELRLAELQIAERMHWPLPWHSNGIAMANACVPQFAVLQFCKSQFFYEIGSRCRDCSVLAETRPTRQIPEQHAQIQARACNQSLYTKRCRWCMKAAQHMAGNRFSLVILISVHYAVINCRGTATRAALVRAIPSKIVVLCTSNKIQCHAKRHVSVVFYYTKQICNASMQLCFFLSIRSKLNCVLMFSSKHFKTSKLKRL